MSYDGGLSIKIDNPVLLEILQSYIDIGAFEDSAVTDMIGGNITKEP